MLDVFYYYLGGALVLMLLPFFLRVSTGFRIISNVLAMPNTLVHEICHALATFFTFGRVHGIHLYANTAGKAFSSTGSWLSRIITVLAGYTGSSVISVLFVHFIFNGDMRFVIYTYMFFSVLTLIWIRNGYGFVYTFIFNAFCGYMLWKQYTVYLEHLAMYLTAILIVHSLYSSYVILLLSWRKEPAGDAESMRNHTKLPTLFWGLFFFGFSIGCTYYIITQYLI